MIEVRTKLRKWGNSLGVVVPKEGLKTEGINEDEEVRVLIMKDESPLEEMFGTLKRKSKKSTQVIMKEIDKELDTRF